MKRIILPLLVLCFSYLVSCKESTHKELKATVASSKEIIKAHKLFDKHIEDVERTINSYDFAFRQLNI